MPFIAGLSFGAHIKWYLCWHGVSWCCCTFFEPLNNILLLLSLCESGLRSQRGILGLLGGSKLKIRGHLEVAYCIFCWEKNLLRILLFFILISFFCHNFFPIYYIFLYVVLWIV